MMARENVKEAALEIQTPSHNKVSFSSNKFKADNRPEIERGL
jgi:hypothetical protein